MSETTSSERALGQLVRVSVVAGDRRMDVAAPAGVPVAEILPGLARHLNMLDAATVYGGYRLTRPEGSELDADRSLQAQGVADGDILNLISGADAADHRVYDDIVEAVADVVESDQKPWSPQDAATTAVLAAVTLLVTAAVMLAGAGLAGPSLLVPVSAGLTALLLLVSAVVIDRVGGPGPAPVALVLTGAIYAAVAGLTAGTAESLHAQPMMFAGLGAAAVGGLGLVLLRQRREFSLIPAVAGLLVAAAAAAVEVFDVEPGAAFAIVTALSGLAGVGIPWLALSATPLQVVSARDDDEILLDPPEVDRTEVAILWGRGHRVQVALRIAVGVITLISTPIVLGTGLFGLALLVLAYCGMILSVRETYARLDVVAVMTIAIIGIALTGVSAALLQPTWRTGLTVGVGVVAAAIVGLSLVAPKPRLRLGRLADSFELLCLALLLPLAVLAADLT